MLWPLERFFSGETSHGEVGGKYEFFAIRPQNYEDLRKQRGKWAVENIF